MEPCWQVWRAACLRDPAGLCPRKVGAGAPERRATTVRCNSRQVSRFEKAKTAGAGGNRLTVPPERWMIDKDPNSYLPLRNGPAR